MRPHPERGYTVIEVMMALAVLTLGAAGVIAMQKATLIANTSARNLVTASDMAQEWMERLRVDSLSWNEPGGITDLTTDPLWLGNVGAGWFAPTANQSTLNPWGTPMADVMGADLYSGDSAVAAFCPQVRLTRFTTNPSTCASQAMTAGDSNLCTLYRMIRVEVRVYWDKSGRQLDCTQALPSDYTLSRYGFVYLVSAALENNSPL